MINLKSIPGLDHIKEEDGVLKIGALTRLEDIAKNDTIRTRYTALAQAAGRTASPHVREMGTIGGNICQLIRCWYFRKEDNRFDCMRKGGKSCYATVGDNRYHSIFGATRVCPPPCMDYCQAGNDIPSYLSQLREDDLPTAARTLLNTNPLAAITGRVCPHYCERNCNRNELDEAISIRSIERYVGDYMLDNAKELFQAPAKEVDKKVAIVGSGPAGLTAAYFLRRLGYDVTVFEAMEKAGGMLTYGIPPYRLPNDVVRKLVGAIESMGVKFKLNARVGSDANTLEGLRKEYQAVFCATGAWKPAGLGMAGEELLTQAIDFLAQVNNGMRKIPAERVLVIGGGSVAVDAAISARRLGAKEVSMACLESRSQMPALPEDIEQAIAEGVKILPSWGPCNVLKIDGKLGGMELGECTCVYDSENRFAPAIDETVKETVQADMVILAIGQRADLSYAESSVNIDRGLITVHSKTQATNMANVFAGGDATISGPLSVVAAIAGGRRAAEAINQSLGGKISLYEQQLVEHLVRSNDNLQTKVDRVATPMLPRSQFSLDKEDTLTLDAKDVEREADRCLNCGCDGVNPSDMAPALVALDAKIVTTQRTIKADEFWVANRGLKPTILEDDEIITEIQISAPNTACRSAFEKFALRKSIDFPIVNCAVAIESDGGDS